MRLRTAPAEVSGFSGGSGRWVGTRSLGKRGGDGAGQRGRGVPGHGSECPAHTAAAGLVPSGGVACGNVISDWSYMGGFQIRTSLKASGCRGEEARGVKQMVLEQDEKQGAKSTQL